MGKVKIEIYCYLIADILTKVLQKCLLSDPPSSVSLIETSQFDWLPWQLKVLNLWERKISWEASRGIKLKLYETVHNNSLYKTTCFVLYCRCLSTLVAMAALNFHTLIHTCDKYQKGTKEIFLSFQGGLSKMYWIYRKILNSDEGGFEVLVKVVCFRTNFWAHFRGPPWRSGRVHMYAYNGKNENWHLLLFHCGYFDESFLEMFFESSSTKHTFCPYL